MLPSSGTVQTQLVPAPTQLTAFASPSMAEQVGGAGFPSQQLQAVQSEIELWWCLRLGCVWKTLGISLALELLRQA